MIENMFPHLLQDKLDILFARAIYASETTLSHFENKCLKDFFLIEIILDTNFSL